MEPKSTVLPEFVNGFNVEDETLMTYYGQPCHVSPPDLSFLGVPFVSPNPKPVTFDPYVSVSSSTKEVLCSTTMGLRPAGDRDSSSTNYDSEHSDPVLKYIAQILMEDDVESKLWEVKDQLALRDTELSLSQVLGERCMPLIDQPRLFPNQISESPENTIAGSSNENDSNSHSTPTSGTSSGTGNLAVSDVEDHNPSLLKVPLPSDLHLLSSSNFCFNSTTFTGTMGDCFTNQNVFNDVESSLHFKRGYDEASKFIPNIDLESNNFSSNLKAGIPYAIDKEDRKEREQPTDGSRGRKNRDQEEIDVEEERSTKQSAILEEESTKQSAISVEESDLSELFDKILLFESKPADDEAVKFGTLEKNKRPIASKGRKTRSKSKGKEEIIEVRDLLILCARAVSSSACRTTCELLKQIKERASPVGDGFQRLAHYFAIGLEARIKGSEIRIQNFYGSLSSLEAISADTVRAFSFFFKALPYELPIIFANKNICKMAENAKALHIVDFGISYGIQWPNLIELLSARDGGPPKLRITGIELPQRGLKPAERVEETGHVLAGYCERFNVPFEFNGIALQDWESLLLEDLKIDKNEMLVANNLYRFESLLDETRDIECPRDAVLRIIRSMNPDIFVHSVINGSFSGPFFAMRFREALFYYSSIFDALDTVLSRQDAARLIFEGRYYGREIMNVVACEGSERVVRAESYREWSVRNLRAGFKPVPLDQELVQNLRERLKTRYHKDIAMDEDGAWLLQGWKGRIIHAWSCWVPSKTNPFAQIQGEFRFKQTEKCGKLDDV